MGKHFERLERRHDYGVGDGHIAQRWGELIVFSEGPPSFEKRDVLSLCASMGPCC